MGGSYAGKPDPGANTSNRYQAGTSAEAIRAAFGGWAAG